MTHRKLFRVGLTGSIVMGLCCFTPVLAIVLSALGLSGVLGFLLNDLILLPLLAIFFTLTVYAIWMRKTAKGQ